MLQKMLHVRPPVYNFQSKNFREKGEIKDEIKPGGGGIKVPDIG